MEGSHFNYHGLESCLYSEKFKVQSEGQFSSLKRFSVALQHLQDAGMQLFYIQSAFGAVVISRVNGGLDLLK